MQSGEIRGDGEIRGVEEVGRTHTINHIRNRSNISMSIGLELLAYGLVAATWFEIVFVVSIAAGDWVSGNY